MAQSQNFNGKSIAILRSAVREIHVYKRIPSVKSIEPSQNKSQNKRIYEQRTFVKGYT